MTVPGRHEEASYLVCTYQSAHQGYPPVTINVKTGCRVRCRMNVGPISRNEHTKDVSVVSVEYNSGFLTGTNRGPYCTRLDIYE